MYTFTCILYPDFKAADVVGAFSVFFVVVSSALLQLSIIVSILFMLTLQCMATINLNSRELN